MLQKEDMQTIRCQFNLLRILKRVSHRRCCRVLFRVFCIESMAPLPKAVVACRDALNAAGFTLETIRGEKIKAVLPPRQLNDL